MRSRRNPLFTLSTAVLAALTSLLGLGSCRTQKTSIDDNSSIENKRNKDGKHKDQREKDILDSLRNDVEMERVGRVRLLYGVPPTRYVEKEEIEQLNKDKADDTKQSNE